MFQVQEAQQAQQAQADGGSNSGGGGTGGGAGGSSGQLLHDPRHAFVHVGPRTSRHNDYYGTRGQGSDPHNPWGNRASGGGSYGRALQRLGERYGIRHWG